MSLTKDQSIIFFLHHEMAATQGQHDSSLITTSLECVGKQIVICPRFWGKFFFKESCILIFCSTEEDCYLCSRFCGQRIIRRICILNFCCSRWVDSSLLQFLTNKYMRHLHPGYRILLLLLAFWRLESTSSSYIIWLKPICSRCCGVMRTAASEMPESDILQEGLTTKMNVNQ